MSCEAGLKSHQNMVGYCKDTCSTSTALTGQVFPGWFMLDLNSHEDTLAVAFSGGTSGR